MDRLSAVMNKARYHHGDLEAALTEAARKLIERDGRGQFSVAEACKFAGVSTAAPYRHFRDKQAILEAVAAHGFDALAERTIEARAEVQARNGDYTEQIAVIGKAYVAYAKDNPEVFRLLFGSNPNVKDNPEVNIAGKRCFGVLIETVRQSLGGEASVEDVHRLAVPLWTFVHGAASLLIDKDYHVAGSTIDVDAMVEAAAYALIKGGFDRIIASHDPKKAGTC